MTAEGHTRTAHLYRLGDKLALGLHYHSHTNLGYSAELA